MINQTIKEGNNMKENINKSSHTHIYMHKNNKIIITVIKIKKK